MAVDTGGGECSTIADRAWHVLSNTNHSSLMSGHQSGHEQVLSVVNAVTKAYIEGRDEPVLFVMHHATPVADESKKESLHAPFQSMRHGVKFDLTTKTHGGKCNMTMRTNVRSRNEQNMGTKGLSEEQEDDTRRNPTGQMETKISLGSD